MSPNPLLSALDSEPDDLDDELEVDDGEDMAREEAGKDLASALGVSGKVDGKAVVEAIRTIFELGED